MSGPARDPMLGYRGTISPAEYFADPFVRRYADDAMRRMNLTPADVGEVEVLEHHYRATIVDVARYVRGMAEVPTYTVWCRR